MLLFFRITNKKKYFHIKNYKIMKPLVIEQNIHSSSDILKIYYKEINKFKPIDEVDLCKKIKEGNKSALDELVNANLKFVVSVAKHYKGFGHRIEDLISEGNLGLIRAAEKFDSETGNKFISYAVWHIRSRILSYIQKYSSIVRVPSPKTTLAIQLKKEIELMEQEIGHEINYSEAASLFENKEILDFLYQQYGHKDLSLDFSYGDGEESFTLAEGKILIDNSFRQDLNYDNIDLKKMITWGLNQMPFRYKTIISCHLGYGVKAKSIKEISEELEISDTRVRACLKLGLRKLGQLLFEYDSGAIKEFLPEGYMKRIRKETGIFRNIKEKEQAINEEVIEKKKNILSEIHTLANKETLPVQEYFSVEEVDLPIENNIKNIFKKIFKFL